MPKRSAFSARMTNSDKQPEVSALAQQAIS